MCELYIYIQSNLDFNTKYPLIKYNPSKITQNNRYILIFEVHSVTVSLIIVTDFIIPGLVKQGFSNKL